MKMYKVNITKNAKGIWELRQDGKDYVVSTARTWAQVQEKVTEYGPGYITEPYERGKTQYTAMMP